MTYDTINRGSDHYGEVATAPATATRPVSSRPSNGRSSIVSLEDKSQQPTIQSSPMMLSSMRNNMRRNGKVFIVDWDDTILPSTFVDRWQIEQSKDLPLHFQNLLEELAQCADRFLAEASKYGEVILITNSDEGWVEFSAQRYCPALLPVVAKYRVVSARTRYEKFYPGQPLCWKAAAFAHEVNEIYEKLAKDMDGASSCGSMEGTDVSSTSSTESAMEEDILDVSSDQREIISFGDSNEERTAVKIVSGQLDARSKSVKFLQGPTLLQIIGQLYMLTNHMQFVSESPKALDMHITEQQATQCAQTYLRDYGIHYDENIVPNYVPRSRKSVMARPGSDSHAAPVIL